MFSNNCTCAVLDGFNGIKFEVRQSLTLKENWQDIQKCPLFKKKYVGYKQSKLEHLSKF